jgi:DNA-directed RNA polymerase subunit RPC12/RpoP
MSTKNVRCYGCGRTIKIQATDPEFMCSRCGAKNVVPKEELYDAPLDCIPPTGFEWALPAGKLSPIAGEAIYVTAQGSHLKKKDYIRIYGIDPEIAYQKMRKYNVKSSEEYKKAVKR